jgi:signal transduction histidine kinase
MQAAAPKPPKRAVAGTTELSESAICLDQRQPMMGKRRRFMIHRNSQIRMALMVTAAAAVVVTLLNIALHVARSQATAVVISESPLLLPILAEQNRFEFILGLSASAVFLAGLFAVTVLETHKTAGAAYRITLEMERVRDGQYGSRLGLRKGDNLREIEAAFNEMSQALADRGAVDIQELEHIASVAARIENPLEAGDLARALRELADDRRKLLVSDSSD